MHNLLNPIDRLLNRFTMYKVTLFGLFGLWMVAEVLAYTGLIGVSATGMALSLGVLAVTCYAVTAGMAACFKTPFNQESYFITALILTFIVPPIDSLSGLLWVVLCGVIAMASKYLLTWRGSHVFNPAAFGVLVVSIAGVLPVTWWVATPNLLPFTILLALVMLRKQRNFQLFGVFALSAVAILLVNGVMFGNQTTVDVLTSALRSWPIIFMGSIMLTEPLTLPAGKQKQLLLAALVGVVFAAQLHAGPVSTTPQFALIVGNLFAVLVAGVYGTMLRLTQLNTIAPGTLELVFSKPTGLHFTPGQYIEMTLPYNTPDLRGNRRTFSIASAPHEDDVRFGVRAYNPGSGFKSRLQKLNIGDGVRIANVKGHFVLPANARQPLLFIAGGIGITPFRSMIAEMVQQLQHRDIRLLYVAASSEQFVYQDVLTQAAEYGVITDYITPAFDGDELQRRVPDLADRHVYISGPDGMVRHYGELVRALGVPAHQIHKDHFSGY
jgi:ferredoxin-NADP reductase